MNFCSVIATRCSLALILVCSSLMIARAQTVTSRIVSTANAFLSTLDAKQRQSVMFAFNDKKQRATWSNFPVSFVRKRLTNTPVRMTGLCVEVSR